VIFIKKLNNRKVMT